MSDNWTEEIYRLSKCVNNRLSEVWIGKDGLDPISLQAYLLSLVALENQLSPIFTTEEKENLQEHMNRTKESVLKIRKKLANDRWECPILSNQFLFAELKARQTTLNDLCKQHGLTSKLGISGGE